MTNKTDYVFYSDPGHGWLKVRTAELERLGIADKISPYSYANGEYAYLEEDMDAATFKRAKQDAGEWGANWRDCVREVYQRATHIRNYDCYRHADYASAFPSSKGAN